MVVSSISTYALHSSLRSITLLRQTALNVAQKEVATGRFADIGYKLGGKTHFAVSIENEMKMIGQMKVTNSFVTRRMETMQISIGSMVETANDFLADMSTEITSSLDRKFLRNLSLSALENTTASLNISYKGEYIFSGVNSDSPAMVDYEGVSGAPAKQAVQDAFSNHFGFDANDPAAANLSKADMKGFLDGPYNDLFNDSNWQTLWSSASERGMRTKISSQELIEMPSTAQSEAYRKMIAASVLMVEFADTNLNDRAIDGLAEGALNLSSNAVSNLADEQGQIGLIQERVSRADNRMSLQKDVLANQLNDLTGVDPYEAAVRLQSLVISLEASYAATARIQSLSIMNYI